MFKGVLDSVISNFLLLMVADIFTQPPPHHKKASYSLGKYLTEDTCLFYNTF